MKSLMIAVALSATATLAVTPASAGDIQGDAYSCPELWTMRNQIYKNAGYCFKSSRAMAAFGNAGCKFDSIDAVPLSNVDRTVLRDIARSSKRQHCS